MGADGSHFMTNSETKHQPKVRNLLLTKQLVRSLLVTNFLLTNFLLMQILDYLVLLPNNLIYLSEGIVPWTKEADLTVPVFESS